MDIGELAHGTLQFTGDATFTLLAHRALVAVTVRLVPTGMFNTVLPDTVPALTLMIPKSVVKDTDHVEPEHTG
jgi:hypothetical protein